MVGSEDRLLTQGRPRLQTHWYGLRTGVLNLCLCLGQLCARICVRPRTTSERLRVILKTTERLRVYMFSGPRTVFLFNWLAPSSDHGVSILTEWPRTAAVFSHRVVLGLPRVSTQCVLLNIYAIYRICRQYSHRLSSICLVQLHKSSKFSSVDQVLAACRICCIYTARKDEIVFFGCFLYGQFIFCK